MSVVIFDPDAELEMAGDAAYYEERRPGAGLRFLQSVEEACDFLLRYPDGGGFCRTTTSMSLLLHTIGAAPAIGAIVSADSYTSDLVPGT